MIGGVPRLPTPLDSKQNMKVNAKSKSIKLIQSESDYQKVRAANIAAVREKVFLLG